MQTICVLVYSCCCLIRPVFLRLGITKHFTPADHSLIAPEHSSDLDILHHSTRLPGVVSGKLLPNGLYRSALRRKIRRQPHNRLDERVISAFVKFGAIPRNGQRPVSLLPIISTFLTVLLHAPRLWLDGCWAF